MWCLEGLTSNYNGSRYPHLFSLYYNRAYSIAGHLSSLRHYASVAVCFGINEIDAGGVPDTTCEVTLARAPQLS